MINTFNASDKVRFTSIFPAKRNKLRVLEYITVNHLMKSKKLHTDECYVCIISLICSVLVLILALMSWPWLEAMALVMMVVALLTSEG